MTASRPPLEPRPRDCIECGKGAPGFTVAERIVHGSRQISETEWEPTQEVEAEQVQCQACDIWHQGFEEGIRAVRLIRCLDHRNVPQINANEITGAECGACIGQSARAASPETGPGAEGWKHSRAVSIAAAGVQTAILDFRHDKIGYPADALDALCAAVAASVAPREQVGSVGAVPLYRPANAPAVSPQGEGPSDDWLTDEERATLELIVAAAARTLIHPSHIDVIRNLLSRRRSTGDAAPTRTNGDRSLAVLLRNAVALLEYLDDEGVELEDGDEVELKRLMEVMPLAAERLYPLEESLRDQGFPNKLDGSWPAAGKETKA